MMVTFLNAYDGRIYVFLSICELYVWFFLQVLAHLTPNGEKFLWYVCFCGPWKIFLCLIFENEKIYLRPIDRESEFDFLESAPDGIDRVFTKDFVPFFPINRFLIEFNLGAIRRPRAANSIN